MRSLAILRRAAAAATLLLAAACRDGAIVPPASGVPSETRSQIRCVMEVRAAAFSCDPARPPGIRGDLTRGSQGVDLRLASRNVHWDAAAERLTADVTVQNLLDETIGFPRGLRVFFASGPTVTAGTGTVSVLADSVGSFTASSQPYYVYPDVLAPRETSHPRSWSFSVPATVERFEFLVYVTFVASFEYGVLHWTPELGSPVAANFYNVWAASPHDVFAFRGRLAHFDGTSWRDLDDLFPVFAAFDMWGSGPGDLYGVGPFGVYHDDGSGGWTRVPDPDVQDGYWYGVWGFAANDVWVVGSEGRVAHFDGADWKRMETGFTIPGPLYAVWGSAPDNLWITGGGGEMLHYQGGAWSRHPLPPTFIFGSLFGTGASDVWAAGSDYTNEHGELYHYDGAAWNRVADSLVNANHLWRGWASGPADVWIGQVHTPRLLHYDGSGWSAVSVAFLTSPGATECVPEGVTGTGPRDVYVVGGGCTIGHFDGSAWTRVGAVPDGEGGTLATTGFWGPSATDVWALTGGDLWHRDPGGKWTPQGIAAANGIRLTAIGGTDGSLGWAAGDNGVVLAYQGGQWIRIHADSSINLMGVWGSSPSNVVAVGARKTGGGVILRWDGQSWTDLSMPDQITAVWGTASDVFVGGRSIYRWTGSAWAPMSTDSHFDYVTSLWGSGAGDVYALWSGDVLHYDGNAAGTWQPRYRDPPGDSSEGPIRQLWGAGPNDVFILQGTRIRRLDRLGWSVAYTIGTAQLTALWGTSARELYVGGEGFIARGQR